MVFLLMMKTFHSVYLSTTPTFTNMRLNFCAEHSQNYANSAAVGVVAVVSSQAVN